MADSNITGSVDVGDMTRVDDTIVPQPLLKIKDLLPVDSVFQSFEVPSMSVLKLLSNTQTEKVMDMMAKGSYVRYGIFSILHFSHFNILKYSRPLPAGS